MESKAELLIRLLKEGKINSEELMTLAMDDTQKQVEYVPYVPAPYDPWFPNSPFVPWTIPGTFIHTTC